MRKRRITRKLKAPKTTELIASLKGQLDEKKLKVGDILYTSDVEKMLIPEGFHGPTAQNILNISVRAGILERATRGQVVVTEALRDFSVRKILGIIKRRNRAENARVKNGRKGKSRIQKKFPILTSPTPIEKANNVIEALVNECSFEELMAATHQKAVQLLEKEINEKSSYLSNLKEEMKRLNLITA